MSNFPTVSIVIVNLNGKQLLRNCIKSIKRLDYPGEKLEVVVVDNGSTDGSVEFLHENYKSVKVIRNTKNEGFAKPSNDGARAAKGEYVAFLNSDMRVEKNWLIELMRSLERSNAKCAGSVILNWDGKRLDFAGGGVNFLGLGYHNDFNRPMSEMEPLLKNDRELLFACGGAMIVERETFLFAGGFDEDYFAYFEDTDLGWRLNILGCKTVLSVKSRVYHKHSATSKTIVKERIQYLFERNKLFTCYKNYGDDLFYKVFMPSLLLQIREAYIYSGIDGYNYDIKNPGQFDNEQVKIGQRAAMKLTALNEFAKSISSIGKKREFIQKNRKVPDEQIIKFMDKPFYTFPMDSGEFLSAEFDIVKAFGIDKKLSKKLKTNVLFITGTKSGTETEKSKFRCRKLSELLERSDDFEATIACPNGFENGYEKAVPYNINDFTHLMEAVRKSTVVVLLGLLPCLNNELKNAITKKHVVADMASLCGGFSEAAGDNAPKFRMLTEMSKAFNEISNAVDFYVCGSGAQNDCLLGIMASHGALDLEENGEVTAVVTPEDTKKQNAFTDFCRSPHHMPGRENAGLAELENESGGTDINFQPHGSIRSQLARIEKQQAEIKHMLVSYRKLIKETHFSVGELKNWSLLMESRFFKLKHKLSHFKIFRHLSD